MATEKWSYHFPWLLMRSPAGTRGTLRTMSDRRGALVGFVVLVLVLAGAGWWLGARSLPTEGPVAVETSEGDADDYDPFAGDDDYDRRPRQPSDGDTPVAEGTEARVVPNERADGDERWRDTPEREARRSDPERRRRIAARRVEIVPLGETAPAITPERVMDAVRARRAEMRECFRSAGVPFGRRQREEAGPNTQSSDTPRPRRSIAFDLDAEGRVTAGSTSFTPPLPEALSNCLRDVVQTTAFDAPGPDGARIEMQLGGGGRRSRGRDAGAE